LDIWSLLTIFYKGRAVLILMLILSGTNIFLGFALAVYLGYGPAELHKNRRTSNIIREPEAPVQDVTISDEAYTPSVASIEEPSPDSSSPSAAKIDVPSPDSQPEPQNVDNPTATEEKTLEAVGSGAA
jgi:hypothetical protein